MRERHPRDRHAQIAGIGEVRKTLPSWRMFLREKDRALAAVSRSPLPEPPLKRAQRAGAVLARIASCGAALACSGWITSSVVRFQAKAATDPWYIFNRPWMVHLGGHRGVWTTRSRQADGYEFSYQSSAVPSAYDRVLCNDCGGRDNRLHYEEWAIDAGRPNDLPSFNDVEANGYDPSTRRKSL